MDLILWRHADAADAAPGEPDVERALTRKGRTQAKRMAAWLKQHLPADAAVLVSPALRAQQTAKALQRKFSSSDALGPSANGAALLKAVRWPQAEGTVVVVGHQPTLGHVASLLLTGVHGDLSIRKGAVWWLKATGPRRRGREVHAVLHAVMTPELL
jgi:phosphohistidine phosphatase